MSQVLSLSEIGSATDDCQTRKAHNHWPSLLLHGDAETDPERVKNGGCKDKSHGELKPGGGSGHFRTVSMAVAQSEQADEGHAGRKGHTYGRSDKDTQNQNGSCDALLHERQGDAAHPEQSSSSHDEEKSQWNKPEGSTAHLRRPKPDRDHGADVVDATQRMAHSAQKSARFTNSNMGMSQRGDEEQGQSEQRVAFDGWCIH